MSITSSSYRPFRCSSQSRLRFSIDFTDRGVWPATYSRNSIGACLLPFAPALLLLATAAVLPFILLPPLSRCAHPTSVHAHPTGKSPSPACCGTSLSPSVPPVASATWHALLLAPT